MFKDGGRRSVLDPPPPPAGPSDATRLPRNRPFGPYPLAVSTPGLQASTLKGRAKFNNKNGSLATF